MLSYFESDVSSQGFGININDSAAVMSARMVLFTHSFSGFFFLNYSEKG